MGLRTGKKIRQKKILQTRQIILKLFKKNCKMSFAGRRKKLSKQGKTIQERKLQMKCLRLIFLHRVATFGCLREDANDL